MSHCQALYNHSKISNPKKTALHPLSEARKDRRQRTHRKHHPEKVRDGNLAHPTKLKQGNNASICSLHLVKELSKIQAIQMWYLRKKKNVESL
jgi:hypothetical protein